MYNRLLGVLYMHNKIYSFMAEFSPSRQGRSISILTSSTWQSYTEVTGLAQTWFEILKQPDQDVSTSMM